MFWWMTREGRWSHRLAVAEFDAAYARSGLRYYGLMLAKAQQDIEAIKSSRVNVDYPPPKGVAA